jgi:hypothetical protein
MAHQNPLSRLGCRRLKRLARSQVDGLISCLRIAVDDEQAVNNN